MPIWGPHFENFSCKKKVIKEQTSSYDRMKRLINLLKQNQTEPLRLDQKKPTAISELWKSDHGIQPPEKNVCRQNCWTSGENSGDLSILALILTFPVWLVWRFLQEGAGYAAVVKRDLLDLGVDDDHAKQNCQWKLKKGEGSKPEVVVYLGQTYFWGWGWTHAVETKGTPRFSYIPGQLEAVSMCIGDTHGPEE